MNKVGDIKFKEIKRISPSQFYSMKNCAYKSLLAEAFDKQPLLPVSPNVYFGTVLHKMLELITKGIVNNEDSFNTEFDRQVKIVEYDLQENGLDFFIPLQKKLKNFGLKKIQLKKHLGDIPKQSVNSNSVKFHSERWFESKDNQIGGKIDLIVENGNYVEIIDFKTGAITQNYLDDEGKTHSDIKEEYKEQLKLYAYLYFESTGVFPTKLSLVDLAKQKFEVKFTESECKAISEEAKKLLSTTNECVKNNLFSTTPTEANCKYCLYRPACSFFQKKLETDFSFNDVLGEIQDMKKFLNGNVSIYLQNGEKRIIVKNLAFEKYEELHAYKNKTVCVYNLRKEAMEFVYSATETTMIYEYK